jgi:hypothetical protein
MTHLKTGFDPVNIIQIYKKKVIRKIKTSEEENFKKLAYNLRPLLRNKEIANFKVYKNKIVTRRLPLVYPYEWPKAAFFDALKFHIYICQGVLLFGWYVKDFLLSNILFDKTKPVFVDLGSFQTFRNKNSLKKNLFYIFNSMMFPYALLPALAYSMGKNELARTWLSTRFCNTRSKPPSLRELFDEQKWIRPKFYKILHWSLQQSLKWLPINFTFYILNKILNKLDCKQKPSDYFSYYDKKETGISEKDEAVVTCLKKIKPSSVIDIGANTGKYSLIAADKAKVVYAIEEDESCADVLFQNTKKTKSSIITIIKRFEDFDQPVFANGSLYGLKRNPLLFFPLTARLQSELVLCLGLIHHLCLGRGLSFQKISKTLGKICQKYVLAEFVDYNDKLIQNEISFFPAYHQKIQAYSKAKFLNSLKPAFKLIKTFPSDSPTRTLFLFKKNK